MEIFVHELIGLVIKNILQITNLYKHFTFSRFIRKTILSCEIKIKLSDELAEKYNLLKMAKNIKFGFQKFLYAIPIFSSFWFQGLCLQLLTTIIDNKTEHCFVAEIVDKFLARI